ncbi:alpha/beta hydrolase [Sphaerisporangium sp. TRM90804]|uniref:alpha/beta hydrolase n=1 Tax=Sphaerisporangium sp. TRM90804 TaxID=3031113 RepID=UPI0024496424|nr:alpha/beta hydrolase [Sphaerisporangium sp. TRM90804]MDH2423844.1 alpha/beta hydrolase [Sphaerisporangium sp. TRM90804]
MPTRRRVGIAGAIVGTASAGLAAAALAKRYAVGRIRLRADTEASEPFGELRGRPFTVKTSDGVELHAEVDGPDDAPLTLVFCHGYTLNLDSWHYQRRELRGRHRMVFWDQRRHGRSSGTPAGDCSIDRLGDDLAEVLKALVPGPCVLIGHSMGGMTVMALADKQPELFGEKIRGVALISTSAGRLAELTLGLPALFSKVVHRAAPPAVSLIGRRGALVDRGRQAGNDVSFLALRYLGFGDPSSISPTVVDFAESMIRSTSTEVIADFYPALMSHDKLAALDVLTKVPTSIVVGEKDWLTPPEHSDAISAVLPSARLTRVPGASHLVPLEKPDTVNQAIHELLRAVADTDAGTGGALGGVKAPDPTDLAEEAR